MHNLLIDYVRRVFVGVEGFMNENLLNCPFCGGEASFDYGETLSESWMDFVTCSQCGTRTKNFKNKSEAVEAWNKRLKNV